MQRLAIDTEFQALCPPLQAEEREQLTASLLAEGCREPLCVWLDGPTALLLDGHNRYAICSSRQVPYETKAIALDSREEAINWIIANQLGRRNLTPEQKSYLRGKRYQSEKRQDAGHGDQKSEYKNYTPIRNKLAKEYQVSSTTITNDGDFASAVDTLESQVRQDIRETVLRRHDRAQGKITKQQATRTGQFIQTQKVEPQPFMQRQHWKPYQVLEAIDVLADVPQDEHAAVNHLLDGPYIPAEEGLKILKNLAAMPTDKRQHIYRLHGSQDIRHQKLALESAAAKAPSPDPQHHLADAIMLALEQIQQRLRRNWINLYPHEDWSDELRDIEAELSRLTSVLVAIQSRVDAAHHERITAHGTTL